MKKKYGKSSGVKATASGQSAENKSDSKIYRPHWSKTKHDTGNSDLKGKK